MIVFVNGSETAITGRDASDAYMHPDAIVLSEMRVNGTRIVWLAIPVEDK